jgi:hypothetical protein
MQLRQKGQYEITVTRLAGDLFQVKPKAALPPGEYLLCLDEMALLTYDFVIIPAK